MARWITIIEAAVPFDYRWPDRSALLAFTKAGEYFVKDEVADWAVGRGYATEGKASDSTARSVKGRTTRRRTSAKTGSDATPPNRRRNKRVAGAHASDAGGPDNGPAVGPSAG